MSHFCAKIKMRHILYLWDLPIALSVLLSDQVLLWTAVFASSPFCIHSIYRITNMSQSLSIPSIHLNFTRHFRFSLLLKLNFMRMPVWISQKDPLLSCFCTAEPARIMNDGWKARKNHRHKPQFWRKNPHAKMNFLTPLANYHFCYKAKININCSLISSKEKLHFKTDPNLFWCSNIL